MLEPVLDRPSHQGLERLRRGARGIHELAGDIVQRDEKCRDEARGRVVERAHLVVELEGLEPERSGELGAGGERLGALPGHRRPRAVELLGPRSSVKVCSGWRLKRRSCGAECLEPAGAARVRDPGARRDRRGDLRDRAVGDAEEDELGVAALEVAARDLGRNPLAEACGHRLADASSADDTC